MGFGEYLTTLYFIRTCINYIWLSYMDRAKSGIYFRLQCTKSKGRGY